MARTTCASGATHYHFYGDPVKQGNTKHGTKAYISREIARGDETRRRVGGRCVSVFAFVIIGGVQGNAGGKKRNLRAIGLRRDVNFRTS